jgi:hypothetical protein
MAYKDLIMKIEKRFGFRELPETAQVVMRARLRGSSCPSSLLPYPLGVSGSLLGVNLGLNPLPGIIGVYGFLPPGPSGALF